MSDQEQRFGDATGRWAGFGPYYAMFPFNFARTVIESMSPRGGSVLDPFCGRGTVPFLAQATGRPSLGIDLNPVAWVFAKVKTDPESDVNRLIQRLLDIEKDVCDQDQIPENEFQEWAWHTDVLGFLNSARRNLNWRHDRADRTIMGFILANLHANQNNGLSNQMQNSRSVGPKYAVRWWKKRNMKPPRIDAAAKIRDKFEWRFKHGVINGKSKAEIKLGDSALLLSEPTENKFSILFTSPPYCSVTDYRQDSWIRLWMLKKGGALPDWRGNLKLANRELYEIMINTVLKKASILLTPQAVIWVRTDARAFTKDVTLNIMREIWPNRKLYTRKDVPNNGTQTKHFNSKSAGPGEIDVLIPGRRKIPFNTSEWELR